MSSLDPTSMPLASRMPEHGAVFPTNMLLSKPLVVLKPEPGDFFFVNGDVA